MEDTYTLGSKMNAFKKEIQNHPKVKNVSVSGYVPVEGYNKNFSGGWVGSGAKTDEEANLAKWFVDFDYTKTMGLNIVEGRDFDVNLATDSSAVILNQKAVTALGLTDPIGKKMSYNPSSFIHK